MESIDQSGASSELRSPRRQLIHSTRVRTKLSETESQRMRHVLRHCARQWRCVTQDLHCASCVMYCVSVQVNGCCIPVQVQWVLQPCTSQWVLHPCTSQWVLHPCTSQWVLHPCTSQWVLHPCTSQWALHPCTSQWALHPCTSQWVLHPCTSQWVLHPCTSQWVLYPHTTQWGLHPCTDGIGPKHNVLKNTTSLDPCLDAAPDSRTAPVPGESFLSARSDTDPNERCCGPFPSRLISPPPRIPRDWCSGDAAAHTKRPPHIPRGRCSGDVQARAPRDRCSSDDQACAIEALVCLHVAVFSCDCYQPR